VSAERPAGDSRATLSAWRRAARARLAAAGIENAPQEADLIARHALGLCAVDLVLASARALAPAETRRLERLIRRRAARVPLQYLLGDVDFRGLTIRVTPSVLIPRPETEGLVERVLAEIGPMERGAVVDVGTGSGAIALALAAERPKLTVLATDTSPAALRVARANARRLRLRVRCRHGDLTAPVEGDAPLRAVVSNPPYVARRWRRRLAPELAHEPPEALFAAEGGLGVIRRLVPRAARLLAAGGLLALEIGEDQGDRVARLLAGRPWTNARVERDAAGKIRYALARRGG
jgi:release factor glutamine methyltransferase